MTAAVITELQGFLILEPKQSLFQKSKVRVMNRINEVVGDAPLHILLRNFSTKEWRLSKNGVLALAERFAIAQRP